MANYSFENLSPIDFEDLCRDLLQEEFNILLESYSEGRDSGIDFKYINDKTQKVTIVQCKRYKGNYSSLKAVLKKEVNKVKKLNPDYYIITTSADLTENNQNEIKELFSPYIKSTKFIYAKNDLNNLIQKYKQIERNHFKLWLSSSNILNLFLHKDIVNRSEAKLNEIQDRLKIFVKSDAYNETIRILDNHNYCIISGSPGVGKTSLADIISFIYMRNDFEFCYILNNISESWNMLEKDKKQIFYFDDFLGANFLEDGLEKNEDSDLLLFIAEIQKSQNKKLILTTREYILNQAKQKYEKIKMSNLNISKCTIEMANYSNIHKAKILYNHLFYSSIPKKWIFYIIDNKHYHKIIKHPNYNPRLIEFLTDKKKLLDSVNDEKQYYNYFIEKLNNPESIWQDAFNKINHNSQYLLYVMTLSYNEIFKDDLKEAFESLYINESKIKNFVTYIDDFDRALKELEDNFIKINYDSKNYIISFQNPSIRDFLIRLIAGNYRLASLLISNITYFDQLFNLFQLEKREYINKVVLEKEILSKFIEKIKDLFESKTARLVKFSNENYYRKEEISIVTKIQYIQQFFSNNQNPLDKFIIEKFNSLPLDAFDKFHNLDRVEYIKLLSIIKFRDKSKYKIIFEKVKNNIYTSNDLNSILVLHESFNEFKTFFDTNREKFIEILNDFVCDEAYNLHFSDSGKESINLIDDINKEFLLDISYTKLEEKIDELEEFEESDSNFGIEKWQLKRNDKKKEDNQINNIFNKFR